MGNVLSEEGVVRLRRELGEVLARRGLQVERLHGAVAGLVGRRAVATGQQPRDRDRALVLLVGDEFVDEEQHEVRVVVAVHEPRSHRVPRQRKLLVSSKLILPA